ncbi:hypothetical protein CHS0354_007394 [Potamilus streckersoni]|uniref:Peptidase M14 domain-containing protein n=1 Tax=Potamilus streckersoni TaxID=2493646 RepID=A0AAE0VZJ2_9BIVA|nr:hypothetical protein CHS0354_007394 [Potamilus streckersoni]
MKHRLYVIITCLCFLSTYLIAMDVRPQQEVYTPDYHYYHSLDTIDRDLVEIANQFPNFVQLNKFYHSRFGRSQYLLRLTDFKQEHIKTFYVDEENKQSGYTRLQNKKIKLLLSYGEHAREFLPVESLFYLLRNLTNGLSSQVTPGGLARAFSAEILSTFDIYVIVLANPDGRYFVETEKNYCWRGTSTGTDLNRNFAWEFGNKGSSDNNHDEEYRGSWAFSEPETEAFTSITEDVAFDLFISFHSGSHHIYVPYADTVSKATGREPENVKQMLELAATLSVATKHGYKYGKVTKLNEYTADGTIFDYMAGVRKIPFSLAIELWGPFQHIGPSCFDLFNPPSYNLRIGIPLGQESLYWTELVIVQGKSRRYWKRYIHCM